MPDLNPEQLEAVKHRGSPLLVLAGPGSGKTRVVTHRIEDLIVSDRVQPKNILGITFTNKAAGEIKNRLRPKVGAAVREMTLRTFHSLGCRILRKDGEAIGIKPDFVIYDEDDQKRLIKTILATTPYGREGKGEYAIDDFQEVVNSRKEGYGEVGLDEYTEKLLIEYEKRLRAANAADFADLLYLPVRLFDKHPDVLERYQKWWQHVIVDEFQDSSIMQYRMIRRLAPDGKRLCVVGDDDQLIYEWRGARIETILEFPKIYTSTKIIRLEQNYRSDGHLVKRANQIIQQNVKRHHKTIWTDHADGAPPRFYQAVTEEDEAKYVVDQIVRLQMHGVPYTEMAVLYRNNALSRKFEDALRYRAIPYTIVNGHSFYDRAEIKDATGLLRMIANPTSSLDIDRFLKAPPARGVGPTTITRLEDYGRERGQLLCEMLRPGVCWNKQLMKSNFPAISNSMAKKIDELAKMFDQLFRLKGCPTVAETVERALNASGMLKHYEQSKKEDARRRYDNLAELVTTAAEMDRRYLEEVDEPERAVTTPLAFFLEQIALIQESDKGPDRKKKKEPEGVSLMTLHACKGLEFGFVSIVGLEEGLLPSAMHNDIEEERRLFYVGFTRAKKYLLLTCANRRMHWGKIVDKQPSQFLVEIGEVAPQPTLASAAQHQLPAANAK